MTDDAFDWQPLGEAWWDEAGKQLGAKPRQLRFAASKFRGTSNTQAAREAGYVSTDPDGLRSTGYRLARSNITERLLSFAAAESGGAGYGGEVDGPEARRILSSLALAKMDERGAALGQTMADDGLTTDRAIRDLLQIPGGAAGAVCLHMGTDIAISRIALLHDVHKACMADPIAKAVWNIAVQKCHPNMQQDLKDLLARKDWQLSTRQKLWREVGIEIASGDIAEPTVPSSPPNQPTNGATA